jgi:hypothetical protein
LRKPRTTFSNTTERHPKEDLANGAPDDSE